MTEFFDKVKHGMGKTAATVSVKSKELLDATRLKNQLESLGKQKKDACEELGHWAALAK